MLVVYLGFLLILQASFIAGHGNQVIDLAGGGKIIFVTPFEDSNWRPEHKHRERYPDGIKVIQLGDDNGHNRDRDWNSNQQDDMWDYLKLQNITGVQGSPGVQVIQLGGDKGHNRDKDWNSNQPDVQVIKIGGDKGHNRDKDWNSNQPDVQVIKIGGDKGHNRDKDWNSNQPDGVQVIKIGGDHGPKRRRYHDDDDDNDDDDDALRRIFKIFRFRSRRGGRRSNAQFQKLQGRDLGNPQHLAQDRSDNPPLANSQADVRRTRVNVIRQNVPRRMMVKNLRSSQAHLTNMQTLSFPVFEEELQMA